MIALHNTKLSGNIHFSNYKKASVGSACLVYVIDNIEDDTLEFWQAIYQESKKESLPIKIIGAGTNLLISGDYFDGIVVKIDYPDADAIIDDEKIVSAPGVSLDHIVNQAAEYGYDMSVLAGIPGTVGGAVYGNAGSSVWKRNIGEITKSIEVFDFTNGTVKTLDLEHNESFFSWRSNRLKDETKASSRYLIRMIELLPPKGAPDKIKQKIQDRYAARKISDEEGGGTAGSFFASALLPERLQNIIKEKTLVRDLVVNCPVVGHPSQKLTDLNINGASFTPRMAFLRTTTTTTDRDVALLLNVTLRSLKFAYNFNPRMEVDIIGRKGSYTIEEFIQEKLAA